ncbi:hypothetical protein COY95_00490, partial [Candidatus Woesearchaeota archaeon CG_4_10_14_0_8_um_filter_47_5]
MKDTPAKIRSFRGERKLEKEEGLWCCFFMYPLLRKGVNKGYCFLGSVEKVCQGQYFAGSPGSSLGQP